jgi:diguanylate cyclase (GGDEF)-like protein/PAS domain S-box-containing protein
MHGMYAGRGDLGIMEGTEPGQRRIARDGDAALNELLLAPAAVLEALPDPVVATGRDTRIVFVNELAAELFGYARDELIGQPVQTLWPERVRARYSRNMDLYFATEHPLRFSTEVWGLRRDGSEFVGEMSWGVVETSAGPLLLAIGRDISKQRATEDRLRAVAAMGERALAGADPWELASEAVELLRGALPVSAAEVRLHEASPLIVNGPLTEAAIRLPIGAGDELLVNAERELTFEETSLLHAVANILSTALVRRRDEERALYEAVHDPLTGLANRTLLRDRLAQALARSRREGGETGVLFLDLDNFKDVNDAHGHRTGDAVLAEVGERLQTAVRPADTVARFGGDEFVVVCEEVDAAAVRALGDRLQEAIGVPISIRGIDHRLSASIGIALGRSDPETLLGNADVAVYRAKANGGDNVELFD